MAIQRPRFQIDGEIDDAAKLFPLTTKTTIVDITGPGLIQEASYTWGPIAINFAGQLALLITVDGVEIYNRDIEDSERISEAGVPGRINNLQVDITVADSDFDMTLKDMSFLTSFKIELETLGAGTGTGRFSGATLWHKGV